MDRMERMGWWDDGLGDLVTPSTCGGSPGSLSLPEHRQPVHGRKEQPDGIAQF